MLKVHAREWIGPPATTYLLKVLTQQHIVYSELKQKQTIINVFSTVSTQTNHAISPMFIG